MVHDSSHDFLSGRPRESLRDLFKLHLLCERLNLSPVSVAKLVGELRQETANLLGKPEAEVGFDSEFSGREFDLLFTFHQPRTGFGKKRL
jgi:hypothetical protein